MNYKARISLAVVLIALVILGFWLGGFNFVRGESMVAMYFFCIAAACIGLTCPYFEKDKP